MDWQDALADEVRELESNGASLADNDRARAMLRVVRGYEVRLSRLSLRIATSMPPAANPPLRHHLGRDGPERRRPMFRTQIDGVYTDEPDGVKKAGDGS